MLVTPNVLPVTTRRLPPCTVTSAIEGLPMMTSDDGARQAEELRLVVAHDEVGRFGASEALPDA